MSFHSFGVVGYGHFGEFLAKSLSSDATVLVSETDPAKPLAAANGVRAASLDEVAQCDAVIAAVPFANLAEVLGQLRGVLAPHTVVMDVVSTKALATDLLRDVLGDHPHKLATHPLFGPPSMERLEPGLRLVVTYEEGDRATELCEFFEATYGLEIVRVDAKDHDRAMAYMQSLPFFIGRALMRMNLPEHADLTIPSFRKLAELAAIEQHHSPEMFETSQVSNPYAGQAREELLDVLQDLQREIAESEHAPLGFGAELGERSPELG